MPACPHFGKLTLSPIDPLLPLPASVVIHPVQFTAPMFGPIRLLAHGRCVSETDEGTIEYLPSLSEPVEYVLECDEAGEYVVVLSSTPRRISPAEMVVLECSPDRLGALRSLGLWNDLLKMIWPHVVCPEPNQEALSTAFHILRNAFLN